MSLRSCLLFFLLLASFTSFAQDKIYTVDDEVISVKVRSVGVYNIIYKKADNQDGPDYTIAKKDVIRIVYQNGTIDTFNESGKGTKKNARFTHYKDQFRSKYGNNILSVIPGEYTFDIDGSMNDKGIGFCYERLLDRRGHISFTLPVMINFLSDKDFNNNNYAYSYPGGAFSIGKKYTSFSFMPGIKFYPASSDKAIRYSLGGSFFAMLGKEPSYARDPNAGLGSDVNFTLYGLMLTNSVNISATKHFCLSLDFNTGIALSDNRFANNLDGDVIPFAPIIQILLKAGYRF